MQRYLLVVITVKVLLAGCTLAVEQPGAMPPAELGALRTSYAKEDVFVPLPWVVGSAQRSTGSSQRK